MAGVEIDAREVRQLAQDLGRVAGRVVPLVTAVVSKGAVNIKDDLNAQAAGSSFRGMAGSVTYDMNVSIGGISAEIGPDKGRRGGPLGNLFFFGGANGGGGTGDLDGAMNREAPKFEKALGDLLGDVL